MELKEVKYYIAIAEELSLSKAADKLLISQPALSVFIKKLETQAKTRLFEREKNNKLHLTKAGEICLEGCRKIMSINNDMEHQIQDYGKVYNQTITIGVTDDRFNSVLTRYSAVLRQKFPDVRIRTVMCSAVLQDEMLKKGQLDFAHSAYTMQDPEFNYIQLNDVEIDLAVPSEHPLSVHAYKSPEAPERVKLEIIGDTPIVLGDPATIVRQVEENYFKTVGFRPKISIEVSTSIAGVAAVTTGSEIALVPRSFNNGKAAFIALDPPMHYVSGLRYKKDMYLTQVMMQLLHMLKN